MEDDAVSITDFQKALSLAITGSRCDDLLALLEVRDRCGETPLHYLAIERNCDAVQFLLEMGADVNSQDDFGYTVLGSAVGVGDNLSVVNALLKAGAKVNIKDSTGMTIVDGLRRLGRYEEADYFESLEKVGKGNVTGSETKAKRFGKRGKR